MNVHRTTTATSVHRRYERFLRAVLRLAAAVAIGFIGGTLGYSEFAARIMAIQSPPPESGVFICRISPFGLGEFCLSGIYTAGFGLLARRSSGRLAGATVAWLAMACAGLMIAGLADP